MIYLSDIKYKKCGRCKTDKPLEQFNKDKYTPTGYRSQCKECMAKQRVEMRDYYAEIRNNDEYRARSAAYKRNKYTEYKHKVSVRNATRKLRKSRPSNCSECGKNTDVQAHHDDYSKPLDVRWLCLVCHNKWHLINGKKLETISCHHSI